MNKAALLLLALALASAPLTAQALQESTITDEPSVNKPQTQLNQAPDQAAPAQPQSKGSSAPAAAPSQPQAGGQSAPASQAAPAQPAAPAPGAKAQNPSYQPSGQPSGKGPAGASGTWTPGGDHAREPVNEEGTAPASNSSGRIFDMPEAKKVQVSTYSRKEVDQQVMGFFEGGARGLADLISRAFERYGEPTGFIKGNEGAGALVVGLRYGEGWLYLKNGKKAYVYWQSPSVGFDLGVNASKVFCLVYGLTDPETIYQRFPSVDGSAYVVGGFGMNYQSSGGVVLAPIRFGVGLRLGANLGYMGFTRDRTINPF